MFDVNRRNFLLRKNFKTYGTEDRDRYTYWADIFGTYQSKNNESTFKYGFKNESNSKILRFQNSKEIKETILDGLQISVENVYEHLFEEKIELEDKLNIASNLGIQVEQIKRIKNKTSILEIGGGNGILPAFVLNLKETKGMTYTLVEAVPQLMVLQQNVLKYFSIKNNNFVYCSSLTKYKELRKNKSMNIILHLPVWELSKIDHKIDLCIANNVLDQISGSDFQEYYECLNKILNKDTMLSVWGGVEKGGVKDLYLFGYGTFHKYNVIQILKEKFTLQEFNKQGSEFYLLFKCTKNLKKLKETDEIIHFENKLIKNHISNVAFLWIDDNSKYIEMYKDTLEGTKLISSTNSVSTNPHPFGIKKIHISEQKIKSGDKILVFSHRWIGVCSFFEELKWDVKVQKISDRIIIMELKK